MTKQEKLRSLADAIEKILIDQDLDVVLQALAGNAAGVLVLFSRAEGQPLPDMLHRFSSLVVDMATEMELSGFSGSEGSTVQ